MTPRTSGRTITREEQEEFMLLLTPLRHRLMHFARVMTGDYEEARDLVSDTVLTALEQFDRVRDTRAFLGYLFTIATRIHRRRRWRGRFFSRFEEHQENELSGSTTATDIPIDVRILYEAMAGLPEKQREALALFEISGLPIEEIREIQGGTLSAVKMRLVRGREQLGRLLRSRGPDRTSAAEPTGSNLEQSWHPSLTYAEPNTNG